MGSDTTLEQEERALGKRKDTNTVLWVLGGLALAGAFVAGAVFHAPVFVIGGLIASGLGLAGTSYLKSFDIEKTDVDLKARQSAASLTQSLEEKGIPLTPEQKVAITKEEYTKSKGEWQDRYDAENEIYRNHSILHIGS